MRTTSILFLALALAWLPSPYATAEEEPPAAGADSGADKEPAPLKRGLIDGCYVDEYFGLRFSCEGLKKGFGFGGPKTLFSGTCGDGTEIEIQVEEAPSPVVPANILPMVKKGWEQDGQRRSEIVEGSEPRPWALFVQESLAGFKRHHGYAYYARGTQVFIVHAQIREMTETSADTLKAHIQRLEVGAATESYLLAHLVAAQTGKDPRSVMVRLQAGVGYVNNEQFKNIKVGRALLEGALAEVKDGDLPADGMWQAVSALGMAQLLDEAREPAVTTWKRAIALAEKTSQAATLGANSWYNLACAYSLLGRLDEAFDALGKSLSMPEAENRSQLREHAQTDPDLEAMRKDPRWAQATSRGSE